MKLLTLVPSLALVLAAASLSGCYVEERHWVGPGYAHPVYVRPVRYRRVRVVRVVGENTPQAPETAAQL